MTDRPDNTAPRGRDDGGVGASGPGGVAGGDPHRADLVSLRAQRVAFASAMMARLRALGERLWLLPLVLLGLVAVDAALALPAWARAVLGAATIGMALWTLVAIVWPGRGSRLSVLGAARLIEQRLALRDNALVNALQLRTALVSGDPIAASLAERAVDHGVEVVRTSEGRRVVDRRGVARAWVFVLGAVAVAGASVVMMPRVWAAGAARYADPFAGHPAWSPTDFRVSVAPAEVLVGDDATVTVRLAGSIPESVDLVFVDGEGREVDRAGMGGVAGARSNASSPDGERPRAHRLTLHDLREPVRFYPAASTGRGEVTEIAVLDKPRVQATTLVVRAPAYTGLSATSERVDLARPDVERRVLVGSTLELRVDTSATLASADRTGGTLSGDVELLGSSVVQRVEATTPGPMSLALCPVSRSGLRADETARVGFEVVADAPARVTVRAPAGPGERAAVLAETGVPIAAVAEDDVGIGSLMVEWRTRRSGTDGQSDGVRAPLSVARPTRTRWDGQLVLDTNALGVAPGDELELWIEAIDNRGEAFGGPQTTRGGPITVSVIDQQEFRRRTLARMGIDDIVKPYEDIAKAADELARAARGAADAAARAAKGTGSKADAERAAGEAQAKRDALMARVEQRLGADPMVDFDQDMRAGLERLRDRLGDFESGATSDGSKGASDPEDGERAERNAELADVASREAALSLAQPAAKLRLASEMRAELDRLDRIAKRQRALADKLAGMTDLTASDATAITDEQRDLREEADDVCVRLDALGDRAMNTLPGIDALDGATGELTRARREAQESIEAARDIAGVSTSGVIDALVRGEMRDAADAALTDLYFATDPAFEAIGDVSDVVKARGARLDDPEVGEAAGEGQESLRKALDAVEQIQEHLERVRDAVRRGRVERSVQRGGRWSPLGAVAALMLGVVEADVPTPDAAPASDGSTDENFVRAMETARIKLAALAVRLREADAAMRAPLPVMGGSAIELARQVEGAEIAPTMYDAEAAMEDAALAASRERAALAADRLEALYLTVTGCPSQCKGSDDSPLRLITGTPPDSKQGSAGSEGASSSSSSSASGSSGSSAGSAPGGDGQSAGGLPNALDVASASASDAGPQGGAGNGADGQRAGGDDPTDRGGFKRAGTTPGSAGGSGGSEGSGGSKPSSAQGQGGSSQAGQQQGSGDGDQGTGDTDGAEPRPGAGDPRLADRARRFNERLYAEPVKLDKPIEGEGEGARTEADVIHVEGDPVGREGALRSELARAGLGGAEVQAVFERVPPAYRDVVAAYLLRIARDEASAGEAAPEGGKAGGETRSP